MDIKRFLAIFMIMIMAAAFTPSLFDDAYAESGTQMTGAADGDIIVVYEKDAAVSEALKEEIQISSETPSEIPLTDSAEQIREESLDKISEISGSSVASGEFIAGEIGDDGAVMSVDLESGEDVDSALESLNNDPDVAYAQKNFRYELMGTTNDPYLSNQYYLYDWSSKYGANVLNAWNLAKCNHSVSIAVLDSGIQTGYWSGTYYHPDIVSNLDTEHSIALNNTGRFNDIEGHGTHVAGIAAAAAGNGKGIAGASHNANLIALNVFDQSGGAGSGGASTINLVAAYNYLRFLIESDVLNDLHVINMSLGGYFTDEYDILLRSAIKEMREDYDIVTVCAGGNLGTTLTIYPGDFDECVSVTALDENGNNASYSDYNKYKDISAPGNEILSTCAISGDDYYKNQGTSMAAPLVSGIMALLWAENPDLSVDEAVDAIESTARPVNTAKNNHGSLTGSKGVIDAAAAVKYVRDNYSNSLKNIRKFKTKVTLSSSSYKYAGKAVKPKVTIKGLTEGEDFKVVCSNNTKPGKAKYQIVGIGDYTGTISGGTFTVVKGTNPLKVKARTATVKYKQIKKKSRSLAITKLITFTNRGNGTLTYKINSAKKGSKSFKKYFKINKKTGKLTIRKGLKKGTYKIKISVKAAGDSKYNAGTRTAVVKLKIK